MTYAELKKIMELYRKSRKYIEDFFMVDHGKIQEYFQKVFDSITDPYIKKIFYLRYHEALSWRQIVIRFGGYGTECCYRHALGRYLKKNAACLPPYGE